MIRSDVMTSTQSSLYFLSVFGAQNVCVGVFFISFRNFKKTDGERSIKLNQKFFLNTGGKNKKKYGNPSLHL